ncbi:MAG: Ppx/GppA family phosphatase [Thermoleophilaceae bacterium]
MRIAVVDLGTNSTRLLVAEVEQGRLRELERRSTVTRLGEDVDSSGKLAEAAVGRVLETVGAYRELMDELGAERRTAVATSAVRDSSNGADFRALLHHRFDIDARILSGDEEARLTFLGATRERPRGEPTLVLDIGGGSTEFVVGRPGEDPDFHVSTQAGSVRQTERHLADDPPAPEQVQALAEELRAIIDAEVPANMRESVSSGIAVAGTPVSFASIDAGLEPPDGKAVEGYRLSLESVERITDELAAVPLPERREVPGLNPDRAPTIVAGGLILGEAMRAFGLREIEVSEADLLHGAALFFAAESC